MGKDWSARFDESDIRSWRRRAVDTCLEILAWLSFVVGVSFVYLESILIRIGDPRNPSFMGYVKVFSMALMPLIFCGAVTGILIWRRGKALRRN
jgi:Na+/H+-dicarboxylate symporter